MEQPQGLVVSLETRTQPHWQEVCPDPRMRSSNWLEQKPQSLVLNIALAYSLVNYSDVNCIVNKAATFLSFPIMS